MFWFYFLTPDIFMILFCDPKFYFELISNISEANVNTVHCITSLHDIEVFEGDVIDLEVTLRDLEPQVIWLHNGIILRESMWISMTSDGHTRRLTIQPCTKKDEGLYACVLNENFGSDTSSEKVTVLSFCEVTIKDRKKPSFKDKSLEVLKTYQKLVFGMEDSVFEHVTLAMCVAAVIYMWCLYFCQEFLEHDYRDIFDRKF